MKYLVQSKATEGTWRTEHRTDDRNSALVFADGYKQLIPNRRVKVISDPNPIDPIELTSADWQEIYYALQSKLNSATVQGSDNESLEWQDHLRRILTKIGPDGAIANEAGTV